MNLKGKGGLLVLFTIILSGLGAAACTSASSNSYSQTNNGSGDKGEMKNINREAAAAVNSVRGAAVTYVALGDSTGVGVGAKSGGGYVARLFKRIEHEHPGSRLKNFCVSGATTADVLRSQVGQVTQARPTLITLGIGINDIGHGVTPEQFAANYEEIIKRLRAASSAPIVVANIPDVSLAPVVPAFYKEEAHSRVVLFNDKIREIAARRNLVVADAYSETREVIPQHPEFFSQDGFHPSDIGYEYWAKTMWPTVKEALGQ
jgi:lysophospholipase L1-like esterase